MQLFGETSAMYFSSSYGNWLPAEYESVNACNYCTGLDPDYSDLKNKETMYEIKYHDDFHICGDCLDDYLDDMANDSEDNGTWTCPNCEEVFSSKEAFIAHYNEYYVNECEVIE